MRILKTTFFFFASLALVLLSACSKRDKESPVITLNGSENTSVGINTIYSELGATAIDNEDGQMVPLIEGVVNTNIANTYTLSYTVTDKAGNSASVYRNIAVKNLVLYLAGTFSARKLGYDSLGVLFVDTTYSQVIAASTTINNRISFTKFGNIIFAPTSTKINADVEIGGGTLKIPAQSALAKVNNVTKTHYYRGFGTISGDSLIDVTYFDSLPGRTPDRCTLKIKR